CEKCRRRNPPVRSLLADRPAGSLHYCACALDAPCLKHDTYPVTRLRAVTESRRVTRCGPAAEQRHFAATSAKACFRSLALVWITGAVHDWMCEFVLPIGVKQQKNAASARS